MTTGPWDPMAAGAMGRGNLRASDADREHVVDALKAAFAQGRLDKDELEVRAGLAFASRTCAELTAIAAEIPAVPAGSRPPSKPAWADSRKGISKKKVAVRSACAVVLLPTLGAAFLTFYGGYLVLLLFAFIGLMVSAGPSAPQRPGPLPLRGRR